MLAEVAGSMVATLCTFIAARKPKHLTGYYRQLTLRSTFTGEYTLHV